MKQVWMTAKSDFEARGQRRVAGESFQVKVVEAIALSRAGHALFARQSQVAQPVEAVKPKAAEVVADVKAPTEDEARPTLPETSEVEADPDVAADPVEVTDDGVRHRRRYRRRDLAVEESGGEG